MGVDGNASNVTMFDIWYCSVTFDKWSQQIVPIYAPFSGLGWIYFGEIELSNSFDILLVDVPILPKL